MNIKYEVYLLPLALLLISNTPVSVYASTSSLCPAENGYFYTNDKSTRNPRKGGFVSDSAFVGDGVFIAPTAAVCGSASVLKSARIYGKAVVSDEAEVTDKARVYGNARVFGTAYIGGEAKVSDHAQVSGDAIVEGIAWIRGYTKLSVGHYTEGTKKSIKPQSLVDAERGANEKQQKVKLAAEKKQRSSDSLRGIGRMLEQGSYNTKNSRRGNTHDISWSLESISGCSTIRMRRTEVVSGSDNRTNRKTGSLQTKDNFSNNSNFNVVNDN
ncbi:MAG: hypothetical protein JKX75_02460, partial [Gammaproteobacteria bacterium]|nr:hypothetical protein [Gammaproteobacteria bacterium]